MRWLTLEKVDRSSYFQILLEEWRWDLFPETRFEDNLFIPFVKYPHLGNRQALACSYSTVRDSMEDDLRSGTPYRISCLLQQPSGVDRRCQIWPIRGYFRIWYTVMSFLKLISQAFPRPLPQSPLVFFPLFRSLSFSLVLHYLNAWNRLGIQGVATQSPEPGALLTEKKRKKKRLSWKLAAKPRTN